MFSLPTYSEDLYFLAPCAFEAVFFFFIPVAVQSEHLPHPIGLPIFPSLFPQTLLPGKTLARRSTSYVPLHVPTLPPPILRHHTKTFCKFAEPALIVGCLFFHFPLCRTTPHKLFSVCHWPAPRPPRVVTVFSSSLGY